MQMREEREIFRQKLVELISTSDEVESASEDTEIGVTTVFPNNREKEILRYYYYIKHGIETVHVSPLSKRVLTR